MSGIAQTLPVPPLVNEMTMLNAIRIAAGSGGGGGGASTFAALTDKTTADIPSINTPLATALGLLLVKANNLSDLASASTARANLGLGTAATQNLTVTGAGTLATGGFTLTVPATGTAALRGTANVFTAAQTVSSGTNGTAAAPSLVINTTCGLYRTAAGSLGLTSDGTFEWRLNGSDWLVGGYGSLQFYTGGAYSAVGVGLYSALATLEQRNSTNGQTFRVYGTYTDASNYVRASLAATSTTVTLAAETAGTGADNIDLTLTPAGTGNVCFPGGTLLKTAAALTDGAAAQVGTLTNSPTAGNPTKWVPVNDNGTTRYMPLW